MEKLRKDIDNKFKWHLDDMIKDDTEYQELCANIKLLTDKIVAMKGNIMSSSDNLYCYLKTMDQLNIDLERVYVYSYLYHYQDMQDATGLKYKSQAETLVEDVEIKLSFVESEIVKAGYDLVCKYIKENPNLAMYDFALEKMSRYENHILSESEENIIAEAAKMVGTAKNAFNSLTNVDIDLGKIKDENGETVVLTDSNYIKYMNNSNRNVRKQAFKKMYAFYAKNINTISSLYLGNIKENFFSSKVRKYKSPLEQSLYQDNISVDFYNGFIENIHKYIPLLQKYMKIRNKSLGIKSHMYDVYADLAKSSSQKITYEQGIEHLKQALKPLGDEYLKDLEQAFKLGWIDVYHNKYKKSGAYEWGSYQNHPYVSTNYENDVHSVSTLAHELGHAMHTFYANNNQEYIYANYPIFLAEIASTVNEVLIDDYFYKKANTDEEKIYFLQNFLDKVRTTIFRQAMFAEFETIMHDKYAKGIAITSSELCDTYYDLNKLYFGKNIVIDEEIKYEWARIPHFYNSFYVYKYATGLIAALSIASDILAGREGAKERYLEFLRAGASDYPLNILKNAGVDLSDPVTIKKAFVLFEDKLKLLEELVNKRNDLNE